LHFRSTAFLFWTCLDRTLTHFQFPPFIYVQNTNWIWSTTKCSLIHSESHLWNSLLINYILFFGLILLEMLKMSLDVAERDSGAKQLTEISRLPKKKKKGRHNKKKTEMGFSSSASHRVTCWAHVINWSSTKWVSHDQQAQLEMFYSPLASTWQPGWEWLFFRCLFDDPVSNKWQ